MTSAAAHGGDLQEGHRSLTIEIPPAAESPYLFRRIFLHNIRLAIGQAQLAGTIDAQTAVELLRALPPASSGETPAA